MDRYNRIKSLDELRLPKDVALCEIFPLKKKSKIINPNDRDPSKRDPDSRGVKIIRVEHSKNSLMPDIKVGDVIIDVNGAPITAFEYKSREYMAFRTSSITTYIPEEFYDTTLIDPAKPKKPGIIRTLGDA